MRELHFTLDCAGCGRPFARSREQPLTAEPVTLYCRHCGCPHQVNPADGQVQERWPAPAPQPATAESDPLRATGATTRVLERSRPW
jgi:hypothetical protein